MKDKKLRAVGKSLDTEVSEVNELQRVATEIRTKLAFSNDLESLSAALIETPALYAQWAMKRVVASAKLAKLEEERRALEAKLYTEYQTVPTDTGRAPTVETVKSMVRADARVEAVAERIRGHQMRHDLYDVAVRSFSMRLTAIAEVAHLFRSELGAGMKARRTITESEEAQIQNLLET